MPAPPPQNPPPDPPDLDELFDILSDECRRRVLYYLREHDGTAEVTELREHLSKGIESDTDDVSAALHHVVLPKLDDFGVIDHDQHSEQVRYDGGPLATELLEWIRDRERMDS